MSHNKLIVKVNMLRNNAVFSSKKIKICKTCSQIINKYRVTILTHSKIFYLNN